MVFCYRIRCLMVSCTGIPGVVFVLPDSYIDPVNKEYGGKIFLILIIFNV